MTIKTMESLSERAKWFDTLRRRDWKRMTLADALVNLRDAIEYGLSAEADLRELSQMDGETVVYWQGESARLEVRLKEACDLLGKATAWLPSAKEYRANRLDQDIWNFLQRVVDERK